MSSSETYSTLRVRSRSQTIFWSEGRRGAGGGGKKTPTNNDNEMRTGHDILSTMNWTFSGDYRVLGRVFLPPSLKRWLSLPCRFEPTSSQTLQPSTPNKLND